MRRSPIRSLAHALPLAAVLVHAPALDAQEIIGTRDERTARVDALFAAWDRDDSPGCAVGVYRDGAIAYARGYGMADLERRVPITPRSVFDIGSTSKQFTAASIVLLAQQGRLSLDDDVRRWIPELPAYERPITVRHLLHHTSGLRDYINLLMLAGTRVDDVTTDADALAAIARQRELNFAPGDEFLYSNSGYFLLSVIVERASGMPLRAFAREHIFAPLQMERTHYLDSYDDIVPDRALAYAPRAGGLRTDISRWLQTGDGAVFTTVEEFIRWDENFANPRVGGEAMLAELHRPGTLTSGRPIDYSLGLMVDQYRGQRMVSHGGAWGGYRADLIRFPDQHFSVAVLCNLATTNPSLLARRVADVYLADVLAPTAAPGPTAAAESAAAAPTPDVEIAPDVLQALVGTYRNPASRAIRTILFTDGKLFITAGNQRFELRPRSAREFELVNAPAAVSVRFEPTQPGGGRSLVWHVEGQEPSTFEQVEAFSPTEAALGAFTGTYFSEELQATYTLEVAGTGLRAVVRPGQNPTALRPTVIDEFTGGPMTLRFTRGAAGEVTGFLLDVGRVRNVRFVRRPTD